MFGQFKYPKTVLEIHDKAMVKVKQLREKAEERKKRITDIRKEHEIDDSDLIQLLQQAARQRNSNVLSYSKMSQPVSGEPAKMEERTIGAGIVSFITTEQSCLDSEKEQANRLELIARNIGVTPNYTSTGQKLPDDMVLLTEEELRFLDF